MTSLRRALTTWFLLLALGLPLAQPATGSWHCPDGRLCVARRDGRYECTGGPCRMACCAESSGAGCEGVCSHGALPGLQTGTGAAETRARIGSSCRFTLAARVAVAALSRLPTELSPIDSLPALLPDGPAPAEAPRTSGYVPTSDSSPPRTPGLPPTGSRAPPSV